MDATIFDCYPFRLLVVDYAYREQLRAHWAVAMEATIKTEVARLEEGRNEEECECAQKILLHV